jgi:histidine ammonia-lyase
MQQVHPQTDTLSLSGKPLSFANLTRIGARGVAIEADPLAMLRVDVARKVLDDKIARGEPVYGATTGVGAMKDVEWTPEQLETFNLGLVRAHHFGTGAPFPNSVVRSAMAIRVNTALTVASAAHEP